MRKEKDKQIPRWWYRQIRYVGSATLNLKHCIMRNKSERRKRFDGGHGQENKIRADVTRQGYSRYNTSHLAATRSMYISFKLFSSTTSHTSNNANISFLDRGPRLPRLFCSFRDYMEKKCRTKFCFLFISQRHIDSNQIASRVSRSRVSTK